MRRNQKPLTETQEMVSCFIFSALLAFVLFGSAYLLALLSGKS